MNQRKIDFEFEELDRRARRMARAVVVAFLVVMALVILAYIGGLAALVRWWLL